MLKLNYMCNKTKYINEFFADDFAKQYNKTKDKDNPKVLRSYFCNKCKVWHITHAPKPKSQKYRDLKSMNTQIQELKAQLKLITKERNILLNNELPRLNKIIKKLQNVKTSQDTI